MVPRSPTHTISVHTVCTSTYSVLYVLNENVVDASVDNGGSVATDMDTSPKAVMTALQALRKDVTELKRSSLGMDFPHDRKRQKPEASSGTSDPRRGDLASLARRHLSVPTADVRIWNCVSQSSCECTAVAMPSSGTAMLRKQVYD